MTVDLGRFTDVQPHQRFGCPGPGQCPEQHQQHTEVTGQSGCVLPARRCHHRRPETQGGGQQQLKPLSPPGPRSDREQQRSPRQAPADHGGEREPVKAATTPVGSDVGAPTGATSQLPVDRWHRPTVGSQARHHTDQQCADDGQRIQRAAVEPAGGAVAPDEGPVGPGGHQQRGPRQHHDRRRSQPRYRTAGRGGHLRSTAVEGRPGQAVADSLPGPNTGQHNQRPQPHRQLGGVGESVHAGPQRGPGQGGTAEHRRPAQGPQHHTVQRPAPDTPLPVERPPVQAGGQQQPHDQGDVLDGVPGPPAAPAQLHVGPGRADGQRRGQDRHGGQRPSMGVGRAGPGRQDQRRHEGQAQAQVQQRGVDHHGRVLEDRCHPRPGQRRQIEALERVRAPDRCQGQTGTDETGADPLPPRSRSMADRHRGGAQRGEQQQRALGSRPQGAEPQRGRHVGPGLVCDVGVAGVEGHDGQHQSADRGPQHQRRRPEQPGVGGRAPPPPGHRRRPVLGQGRHDGRSERQPARPQQQAVAKHRRVSPGRASRSGRSRRGSSGPAVVRSVGSDLRPPPARRRSASPRRDAVATARGTSTHR